MQGDTVTVGASFAAGDDGSTSAGKVCVYRRDPSGAEAWPHVATLSASDPSWFAYFGSDLALAGGRLLVAARGTTMSVLLSRTKHEEEAWRRRSSGFGSIARPYPGNGRPNCARRSAAFRQGLDAPRKADLCWAGRKMAQRSKREAGQ